MANEQISILGCGWLGFPLAKSLLAKGYSVKGSSTTKSKESLFKRNGITPYTLTVGNDSKDDSLALFLEGSEVVIISFPPKRTENVVSLYQRQIQSIISSINSTQKIIFISSTSVYPNTNSWVNEKMICTPEKKSGKAILAVENILNKNFAQRLTIIRFAGLIGYDRQPGRFLANKEKLINGMAPINLIHRDDCIGLIQTVLQKKSWGEIINGCADEHPFREHFYRLASQNLGLTPPEFKKETVTNYKKICNKKSKQLLQYTYKFPDPTLLI